LKTIPKLAAVAALLAMTIGCATASPTQPMPGFIYSDVKAPLEANNGDFGSKKGTAMMKSILGLVAIGDASIRTAAANGNISIVKHVDFHAMSVLGIYGEFTVTVYGD
jgi:hypothetical protein